MKCMTQYSDCDFKHSSFPNSELQGALASREAELQDLKAQLERQAAVQVTTRAPDLYHVRYVLVIGSSSSLCAVFSEMV